MTPATGSGSPSAINDGLLTASEAATLNLSARLLILSACNTAAGSRAGAGHIQSRTDRDWVNDIARFVLTYRRVATALHAPPQGVMR